MGFTDPQDQNAGRKPKKAKHHKREKAPQTQTSVPSTSVQAQVPHDRHQNPAFPAQDPPASAQTSRRTNIARGLTVHTGRPTESAHVPPQSTSPSATGGPAPVSPGPGPTSSPGMPALGSPASFTSDSTRRLSGNRTFPGHLALQVSDPAVAAAAAAVAAAVDPLLSQLRLMDDKMQTVETKLNWAIMLTGVLLLVLVWRALW